MKNAQLLLVYEAFLRKLMLDSLAYSIGLRNSYHGTLEHSHEGVKYLFFASTFESIWTQRQLPCTAMSQRAAR